MEYKREKKCYLNFVSSFWAWTRNSWIDAGHGLQFKNWSNNTSYLRQDQADLKRVLIFGLGISGQENVSISIRDKGFVNLPKLHSYSILSDSQRILFKSGNLN